MLRNVKKDRFTRRKQIEKGKAVFYKPLQVVNFNVILKLPVVQTRSIEVTMQISSLSCNWRARCQLLLTAAFFISFSPLSQAKIIQLRNGFIDPENATNTPVAETRLQKSPVSGLYLIQFTGPLSAEQRVELLSIGVELVKYVPEDTFIAKLNSVSPSTISARSYITWVGPYKQQYKVHPKLTERLTETATNDLVDINVLLPASCTVAEVNSVKAMFTSVSQESHLRQGIFLRGIISSSQVDTLAQSGSVLWVEKAPKRKLVDEAASKIVGGDDGEVGTDTLTQQMGFDGSGVIVCVADTGLDSGDTNNMHPDLEGRVVGFEYYGDLPDGSDGYGHGTHCAGIVAGNAATGETDSDTGGLYGLGIASGSQLFIERLFDDGANEASPFPSDETMTRDAVQHGAKIGSNSWGNDVGGDYDTDSAQFDELVRDADAQTTGEQPFILEFSAGNAGPNSQTMDSPASGKNVIATGASENVAGTLASTYGIYADGEDTMADFSSRGPCADGRIKPDVVAPGTWIASAASSAADESAVAWTVIDDYYVYMGGTSMAGPFAAGAAAVFIQFYESTYTNATPSPALVKAALINSAEALDQSNGGPSPVPNNDEGWGRITLTNIIVTNVNTAPRYYQYLDQTVTLTNSQVYTHHIFVQDSDQPFKVTLVYTDVPGFPGAIPALVNDLDLEVVGPDGTLYRGNQFGAGESVPDAPTPDSLNNVEGVYLTTPTPGDYLIRVRATKVVEDARIDTEAIDQDFALVSSGNILRPDVGLVMLDRSTYTAPSTMKVSVFDAALATNSTVSVLVTNLTTHTGTMCILQALGNYGAFTGTVATVTGTATTGQIQIATGDNLEAIYLDSKGITRTATAVGDLVPPVVSGVQSSLDMGVLVITWQTTEPATSIVVYGTNSSNLNLGVTNNTLVTSHEVKLTRLIPGKTYYYKIITTDAAGNLVTDNNSGSYFTFTGVISPTVLLVDAYDTVAEENNGATVIPDGSYTNVLTAAGISYGFWKVNERGYPQLSDLQPFPVVIWRITDDIIYYGVDEDGLPDSSATNNTINAQQQYMIQTYLNGGGSFFMASMSILTQLGDVSFRRNVLQVSGFDQNPDPPSSCTSCDEDFGVPATFGNSTPIGDCLNVTLDYSSYPSFDDGFDDIYGPDFSDTFTPSSSATSVAFESVSGKPCGMSFPSSGVSSPGRVVFFSFPFDAIPTNTAAPNNAIVLMQRIIQFLAPGIDGKGAIFLDNTIYTTNQVVTVEVGDYDLIGTGDLQVKFKSSSKTNVMTIDLNETTHPGLFMGTITLVNGTAVDGQLSVQNGDTITATYFDASNDSNVVTSATIDTIPPVITDVAATADYANAQITWATSKNSDSTVQYSESALLDHSSYSSTLMTNHSVTLSGLSANRTYYYQVVSRDQAGNSTVNDNDGQLYSFQTLRAPTPPWFDDLENGTSDWTIVPDPTYGSEINWTVGTPQNSLATSAYSGSNAWGSDLNGSQDFFLASSYLYSPIIDLSGLTSATLTFFDVCDFSTAFEDGVVYISTNSSTSPADLPMAEDLTGTIAEEWELETIDLTPWVGQTIQIVFYYQCIPVSEVYGWTIDDISVTGTASGGTINIAKNLGQGTYALYSLDDSGSTLVQSGRTPTATITNASEGQYYVTFGNVPYYQTPDTLTNTLSAGGSLSFEGNYTFLDSNDNGISDAWETVYFGSVTTNRTQATDTDGDGMSDYAEFIAGTNPTNAVSKLYFTEMVAETNSLVRLEWTIATNRLYQVSSSTNLAIWTPITDWLQASNTRTMSCTVTNSLTNSQFFRVQVQP